MEHNPGAALKAWRAERGLSQAALAATVGVGQSAVAGWESENRRPELPYAAKLEALSEGALRIEEWGHDPAVVTALVEVARLRAAHTPDASGSPADEPTGPVVTLPAADDEVSRGRAVSGGRAAA